MSRMLEENSRGKEKFIPQWNEIEMFEIKLEFPLASETFAL